MQKTTVRFCYAAQRHNFYLIFDVNRSGYSTTASASAFQAGDVGSIPVTRTTTFAMKINGTSITTGKGVF